MTVYTVGHGTRSTEGFAEVLRSAGVPGIVDVRRFPRSRRHPHFAREALERSLPGLGLAYEWRGEALGGRRTRAAQTRSRHGALRVAGFSAFADHMDTDTFRHALSELEEGARRGSPVAIMCAETLWWRCHRRLIADALVAHGFDVRHLIDAGKEPQRHVLHASARIEDGRPVYDVGVTPPLLRRDA